MTVAAATDAKLKQNPPCWRIRVQRILRARARARAFLGEAIIEMDRGSIRGNDRLWMDNRRRRTIHDMCTGNDLSFPFPTQVPAIIILG